MSRGTRSAIAAFEATRSLESCVMRQRSLPFDEQPTRSETKDAKRCFFMLGHS